MNTIEEQIEVMKAFSEGKTIEYRVNDCGKGNNGWIVNNNPRWNWEKCSYRVKADYRPYANAGEFCKAEILHGSRILHDGYLDIAVRVSDTGVSLVKPTPNGITLSHYTYEQLCKYAKWQDGTPCGIKCDKV